MTHQTSALLRFTFYVLFSRTCPPQARRRRVTYHVSRIRRLPRATLHTTAAFLLLLAAACGCVRIKGMRTTGAPPATPRLEFMAGVAKVDITPLPGYPMGGHSIAATLSRGFWTRLHAAAIYLEDARGTNLVLVSCDLWSMPAGLADRVADLVAHAPAGRRIGRQGIILAATHTHQSPGNFSSSPAYNELASPVAGFNQPLFDYLAQRIAAAVLGAVSNAQPAHIALTTQMVPSASRNRSMPAFLLDPESRAILTANASIPPAATIPEYPDARASRAVDPRLRILRLEGPHELLALVGFLAMHPTALGHETEVYSSDIFGVAETLAEESLQSKGATNALVTIFNGPEGDISPMWDLQDRTNALSVGTQLAQALLLGASGGELVDGKIHSVFAIRPIADQKFVDDAGQCRHTAGFAVGGAALVAGAEDGRTIYNYDGHTEGNRSTRFRTKGQGAKRDMLEAGLPFSLPKGFRLFPAKLLKPPTEIPLGVALMGDVMFATLPGEFTTVMGRRIETALKQNNSKLKQVILIGLANEYLSYFATPEEYDAQHYEGASTLYGPASGPLVQAQLVKLARDCASGATLRFPPRYCYSPGFTEEFVPPEHASHLYHPDDGLGNILEDTTDRSPYRHFPSIAWNDPLPLLLSKMKAGRLPLPYVWVESKAADGSWQPLKVNGRQESNEGLDFVTATVVSGPKQFTWTAFWMPPKGIDRAGTFRLCAVHADGTTSSNECQIPTDCPLGP